MGASAGTVYLIHLATPMAHAKHYIGYAQDVLARLAEHRAGTGARLLAVAGQRGIGFELVRMWPGDRTFERKMKNRKNAPRYCPICNPGVCKI